MTDEIIKLYENAGVGYQTYIVNTNPPIKYPQIDFSAEKQLSLIKWLSNFWVHINKVNEQFNISTGGGYVSYYAEDLADAIALYINSKWNNLTEQDRTEIRRILNG